MPVCTQQFDVRLKQAYVRFAEQQERWNNKERDGKENESPLTFGHYHEVPFLKNVTKTIAANVRTKTKIAVRCCLVIPFFLKCADAVPARPYLPAGTAAGGRPYTLDNSLFK